MKAAKAPEIPHNEAYDRAYYASYGIDPAEVMPKREREEPKRRPRFINLSGKGGVDAFWVNKTHGVIVEDPNGPHPTAYEYEHETHPWWTLRQVYPLTPGRVWSWASWLEPMDATNASMMESRRADDVKGDLSPYYTEHPTRAPEGEWCTAEELDVQLRESVLSPSAFDPSRKRGEPKPRPRKQGGFFRAIGIRFDL